MTTFNLIVLIIVVFAMVAQFAIAIEKECFKLAGLFGFELVALAYLVSQLAK